MQGTTTWSVLRNFVTCITLLGRHAMSIAFTATNGIVMSDSSLDPTRSSQKQRLYNARNRDLYHTIS
jgi:hypothetical protein